MSDRPLPTIIGPTENALRALLVHTLADTNIASYEDWVLLNMTVGGAPTRAIATALRVSESEVQAAADALISQNAFSDRSTLSANGLTQLEAGRARVAKMTELLTAGIPEEHLRLCAHVLEIVRTRAESQLSR